MAEQRPPTTLAELQATLYDLFTAPEGAGARWAELGRAPAELQALVKPRSALSAVERVEIYADMYFYRIRDVLREEFEKVAAVVGDDPFHNLITDYLIACRPAHPSLREAGGRLPDFLATHPLADAHPFVSELARLERLHLELYDGPDAAVLTLDEVRALPPADISTLPLRAIPCHAVVSSRFALTSLWRAIGDGATADAVAAVPETILVWRQGLEVYHRAVDPDEAPLLATIVSGTSLERLCERLIEVVPEERAAGRAFQIVGRWVANGLIAAPPG